MNDAHAAHSESNTPGIRMRFLRRLLVRNGRSAFRLQHAVPLAGLVRDRTRNSTHVRVPACRNTAQKVVRRLWIWRGGGPQGGYDRSGSEWECDGRRGTGFSALREYRAPSPRMQSRTREAQPTQYGGLFGMDETGGLIGMSGNFYGGELGYV